MEAKINVKQLNKEKKKTQNKKFDEALLGLGYANNANKKENKKKKLVLEE